MKPASIFLTACTLWPAHCSGTVLEGRNSAGACPNMLTPAYADVEVTGEDWSGRLVVQGLEKPRSIVFDSSGALLVLESGAGIRRLTFIDKGPVCPVLQTSTLIVNMTSLNHGLAISRDGRTIYASNAESVFAWPYNDVTGSVTANAKTIVSGMGNDGIHVTRTLLVSQFVPDTLVVSRGSSGLLDQARNRSSGLGQVKAFNLANLPSASEPYDFSTAGQLLGWGLYNAVAIAEHPITGGIYAMDAGQDNLTRDGVDVSHDNPAAELNYLGPLFGTDGKNQGANFGYPFCHAMWSTSIADAPPVHDTTDNVQFNIFTNSTFNDTYCKANFVQPVLVFNPHSEPYGFTISADGRAAYLAYHNSPKKKTKVGNEVGSLPLKPRMAQALVNDDGKLVVQNIMHNVNNEICPSACMRPVGLALDRNGRLFFSSDATGEIYVLVLGNTDSTKDKLRLATGIGVSSVLVIFGLCVFMFWRWKRSRRLFGILPSESTGPAIGNLSITQATTNTSHGIQDTGHET